jgi:hypothetical protein
MSTQYPNLLIGIVAAADGRPPLMEIVDHLSSGYQRAIFVAMRRSPGAQDERRCLSMTFSR